MKYFIPLFFVVMSVVPQFVFAALEAPSKIVECTDGLCNFCQLIQTVHNVVLWVTVIALSIAVILIMYAGYKIVSSRGDVSLVTEGRKMIGNIAIGIFIIILAATLIDILMKSFTGGDFGVWNVPSSEKCGISKSTKGLVNDPIPNSVHVAPPTPPTVGGDGYDINDPRHNTYVPDTTGSGASNNGGNTGGSNNASNNYGYGNDPNGEFGGTGGSNNYGYGNDPNGEFGNTGGSNNASNNYGYGNDPNGEFGGLNNTPPAYVAPQYGPQ